MPRHGSPALANAPVPVSFTPLPPVGLLPVEEEHSSRESGTLGQDTGHCAGGRGPGTAGLGPWAETDGPLRVQASVSRVRWEEQKHPRPCDRQRPRALRAGRGGGRAHSAATELRQYRALERGRGPQGRSCFPSTAVCSFPFSFSVPTAFMTVSAAAFLPVLPAVAGGAGGCVSRDTQG